MTAVGDWSYHVQDGQQGEVNVDRGDTVPVVDRSNAAVVLPEESPGQLVQRRPLWLLRDTLRRVCCETEINPSISRELLPSGEYYCFCRNSGKCIIIIKLYGCIINANNNNNNNSNQHHHPRVFFLV